jgi:Flp pilus assembly protein TadG
LDRLRRDRRGAGATELVIAVPVLLFLVLLVVQFALYEQAEHIAQAAAAEALSVARVSGGSVSVGRAEADSVLSQLGNGPLQGTSVTVQRGATQVDVSVSGTATNILPFMTFTVRAQAVGPVERFIVPTDAGLNP